VRLGFFTACLPRLPLDDLAGWAAAHGFDALEVAAWPRAGGRDFT
jgi:sugar phosphate isomerase/epimerase